MRFTLSALLFLTLPTFAAQTPTALVLEGDVVPGIGAVTSISHIALNASGDWLVEADTNNADTDQDSVVLVNGALRYREGQSLALPTGALLDSFDSLSLNADGDIGANFFLDPFPTSEDSGVYWNDQLLLREGDTPPLPGLTPGSPLLGFFDVKLNDADLLLTLATVDDPAIASSVDQVLFVLDAPGGVLSGASVVAKEGDLLPGQTEPIALFATGPHATAYTNARNVLFFADLAGDTTVDGVIYLDGALIAQEGSPSPVAGRNWSSLSSPEMDVNEAGLVVHNGTLDGDAATNALIALGGAKFRQEGDTLPAIAPFLLTSFGTGPLYVDDAGSVLWYGDWDDPDTDRDTGLFVDDRLIVQEGVTTVGGVVIDTLRGIQDGYVLSPDGRWLLFEAILADGREGAFRVELSIGQRYCSPAVANSTGASAVLSVLGSDVAGGNPLQLVATSLPPNQFTYFLLSQTQASVPGAGGSQGVLCLGGSIGRFNAQVQNSGSAGSASIDVDTNAAPINPTGPLLAGETWSFQGWYRDFNPTPTSNFTDAVAVTFQ